MKVSGFCNAVGFICLVGCGTSVSGPAEISAGGLTYDVRNGGRFVGLPLTSAAQMPSASAVYDGVYQVQLNEFLEKGDTSLELDLESGEVELELRVEFPAEAPIQIYQNTFEATLTGTEFQGGTPSALSVEDAYLDGDFYGTDGSVAAGSINHFFDDGNLLFGTFIVVD